MIPNFDADGLLAPGDYEVSFEELRQSVLVAGDPGRPENWDAPWRAQLEDKDHPNDIDGYFVCGLQQLATGDLARQLNLLDPFKVWTWDPASRRPYRGYPKRQLPMWHQYRVELYPHVPGLGIGCGIFDKYGNELEFPSAFRQCRRNGKPRGIVKITYGGQP